jgi:hypothetical protein
MTEEHDEASIIMDRKARLKAFLLVSMQADRPASLVLPLRSGHSMHVAAPFTCPQLENRFWREIRDLFSSYYE